MNKTVAVSFVFALLGGCASTPSGLMLPENKMSFVVNEPYQLVFKRINEANFECRHQPLLPVGQAINDTQHYPDLKEAKIVIGASGIGTQITQVISIKGVDEKTTNVSLYATSFGKERLLSRLKKWATGTSGCDFE